MAPQGGLFGSQQRPDDNVAASDNNAGNTPNKDTQLGQPTNQYPPPPGYSYTPSQPPFRGAPQLNHHAPFNMTPSSQPSSGATHRYGSYGPPWPGYDFPQGGYGGPQLIPPQQFTQQGASSPCTPRVPPALPGNIPVFQPTSSASTPYGQLPREPGIPPIRLPTKRFQPAAELRRTDIEGIADWPPLPDIAYDEFDSDYESDDSSDLGWAEGKAPISLEQTEFSLKQFARRMGQPNFSAYNKWKKVWGAGFLGTMHRSMIPGQSHLKQQRDGPLHCDMTVADLLKTFEKWLPLESFNNAEWIWRQWVEMIWKECAWEVREARKIGRRGNKRPATDLGERAGKDARGIIPQLPNTTFMVVIHRVPNGNNDPTSSMQLQDSYTDVRHISNDTGFHQKHQGVPDGCDGSDGTSYPLTENFTLPIAQGTGGVARVPPVLFVDVYASSERLVCYTLRSGCSYAEGIVSPTAASLEMLRVHLENIATTYRSTIFKTYAFSLYSHVCIYVSIQLPIYTRFIWTGSTR